MSGWGILAGVLMVACAAPGQDGWHVEVCEGAVCGTAAEVRDWMEAQQDGKTTQQSYSEEVAARDSADAGAISPGDADSLSDVE